MGNNYLNIINISVLLLCISFSISIVEIPLNPLHVKGIPKYNNIQIIEPMEINEGNKSINNRFLIEEGNAVINTNLLFLANIRIGSNKQQFNLILDTGSFIIWVAQKGSIDSIPIFNHFDPSASNTCRNTNIPFEQAYVTGKCSGTYYIDNFNYINDRDFQISFGVATRTEFPFAGADGIIGLSHYYFDENLSFIKKLNQAGITSSILFSFKFGNDINIGTNGKLYIGKHDDFSKNNVATCPLVNIGASYNMFWACEVSSFGLKNSGNEIKSNRRYNIVFDTGTNGIILPLEYITDLQNNLNQFNCFVVASQDQTTFQISCPIQSDWPDIIFEINGNILKIPKFFLFAQIDNFHVISRFYFKRMDFYIIGTPFFFTFHTLFDKESERLHFYPENDEYLIKRNYLFLEDKKGTNKTFLGNIVELNIIIFCIIISFIALSIGLGWLLYYKFKKSKYGNETAIDDKNDILSTSNNYANTLL